MSMLEIHKQASGRSTVSYHLFLTRYKECERVVYGIVEGKQDPGFYRSVIESLIGIDWRLDLLPAGNRDQVLELFSLFDWGRFNKKRICFFVDRDLSKFVPGLKRPKVSNIYVTRGYSIENDCASAQTVLRILNEVLNVTMLSSEEESRIEKIIERNIESFSEAMTIVMAQIIAWKQNGEETLLNNFDPSVLFEFEDGLLKVHPRFIRDDERVSCIATALGPGDHLTI